MIRLFMTYDKIIFETRKRYLKGIEKFYMGYYPIATKFSDIIWALIVIVFTKNELFSQLTGGRGMAP